MVQAAVDLVGIECQSDELGEAEYPPSGPTPPRLASPLRRRDEALPLPGQRGRKATKRRSLTSSDLGITWKIPDPRGDDGRTRVRRAGRAPQQASISAATASKACATTRFALP